MRKCAIVAVACVAGGCDTVDNLLLGLAVHLFDSGLSVAFWEQISTLIRTVQ